jgi:flavin-dependent dehydrogenase
VPGKADAEVGIVGGGPAGTRAAELLAHAGVEVVVWDPKTPWEKPCGGGLTDGLVRAVPEVREVLPRARAIERVVFVAGSASVPVRLERAMYIIARRDLAEWQLARARGAGAAIERAGVSGIARAEGGWTITLRDGSVRRVRQLIGADGAASLVRKVAAPMMPAGLEPTRVVYPEIVGPGESVVTLKFSAGLEGYAWDFPRPGHRSIGAVVAPGRHGLRALLDGEIEGVAPSVEGERRGAVIGSALYPLSDAIGGKDYALVGDAGALADPATGEGITNAFLSGALAAEVFLADRSFARYARAAKGRFEAGFRSARWLRRLMYRREWAVRLIQAAEHRPRMAAVAARMMNDTNEHRSRAAMIARLAVALVRAPRSGRDLFAGGLVEQAE